MQNPDAEAIRRRLLDRLFGSRIIQNNFRGELVEEIVNLAIGDAWTHCAKDWAAWDFQRDRIRVQVKQSAARQSWDNDTGEALRPRRGVFPIPEKAGYFEGTDWRSEPGRQADIYILAWHADDTGEADHFDL